MRGNIFLSYRRSDEPGFAQAVFGQLQSAFATLRIFMDVEGHSTGMDFVHVLEEQIGQCDVLLAIIVSRWVDARDERDKRRLENPDDLVRIEIESAIRQGRIVFGWELQNASLARVPQAEQCSNAQLADCNRRVNDWEGDTRQRSRGWTNVWTRQCAQMRATLWEVVQNIEAAGTG